MIGFYTAFDAPDCIIGPVPLHTCQYIEVGRSHDVLQYRSVGAEYMGQQKGGNVGIRVDFILPDDAFQPIIAATLQAMHYFSRKEAVRSSVKQNTLANKKVSRITQGQAVDDKFITKSGAPFKRVSQNALQAGYGSQIGALTALFNQAFYQIYPKDFSTLNPAQVNVGSRYHAKYAKVAQRNITVTQDPKTYVSEIFDNQHVLGEDVLAMQNDKYKIVAPDDLKYDTTIWHKTFPFMFNEMILYDCYIETLTFRRNENGSTKKLEGTMLIRQFTPPQIKISDKLKVLDRTADQKLKTFPTNGSLEPEDYRKIKTVRELQFSDAIDFSKAGKRISNYANKFGVKATLNTMEWMINAAWRATNILATSVNRYQISRNVSYSSLNTTVEFYTKLFPKKGKFGTNEDLVMNTILTSSAYL